MEHRYPGKEPVNQEQEQINRQETLAKLGDNFSICWDAWQQNPNLTSLPSALLNKDGKTFNEKSFFESAAKLSNSSHLKYLEYLQRTIQEEMDDLSAKQEKQPNITETERNQEMSELANAFITKLEFFSRISL